MGRGGEIIRSRGGRRDQGEEVCPETKCHVQKKEKNAYHSPTLFLSSFLPLSLLTGHYEEPSPDTILDVFAAASLLLLRELQWKLQKTLKK